MNNNQDKNTSNFFSSLADRLSASGLFSPKDPAEASKTNANAKDIFRILGEILSVSRIMPDAGWRRFQLSPCCTSGLQEDAAAFIHSEN